MTIKSDNWIKKMAQNHGMIEPFAESQIRHSDGKDLISYGTSSYEFMMFDVQPNLKYLQISILLS